MKLVIGLAAVLFAAAPALSQQQPSQPPAAAAESGEALERLARDAHSARMLGILAADKNVPLEVALLGDGMAAANAEIDLRLAEAARARGIPLPRFMPDEARQQFADIAALNQEEFARAFAERTAALYPRLIDSFDQATRVEDLAELRETVGPRLETHLAAARQLAEAGVIDQQTAEALRQEGPIERKAAPEAVPREGEPPR